VSGDVVEERCVCHGGRYMLDGMTVGGWCGAMWQAKCQSHETTIRSWNLSKC
jgi:hypothetical protein